MVSPGVNKFPQHTKNKDYCKYLLNLNMPLSRICNLQLRKKWSEMMKPLDIGT